MMDSKLKEAKKEIEFFWIESYCFVFLNKFISIINPLENANLVTTLRDKLFFVLVALPLNLKDDIILEILVF